MAIPGTREYYDEFMARKAAQQAPAAPVQQIDPASVGLAVPMARPFDVPIATLERSSLSGGPTPVGGEVMVAPVGVAPPPEPAHGSDQGIVLRTGGDPLRDAGLASMRARGLPIAPELSGAQQVAGAEGAAADQYEQAGLQMLGMQGAQRVSSVANPEYGITKEYVGTSRDINARQLDAQTAVDVAEIQRATAVSDHLEQEADRQRAALVDMQARQYAQEEHAIEAQERTRKAYDLVAQATDRLAASPDVDPNRAWANKTAGQRFAARLTMVGRGLLGQDPQGALNAEIERDLEAQKASFAQRVGIVGARQGQLDAARSLYADIRAQTQDEREADEIMRIARLEQAKSALDFIAAKTAIPSIKAAQDQFRLGLEQQIADRKLLLGKIAVHNVRRKTVVSQAYRAVELPDGSVVRVPVGGAGDQARAKYLLGEATANRGDARKVLGEEVAGTQRIEGELAKERAKQAGAPELSDADNKLLMAHVDNTQKAGALSDLISDFERDYGGRDIPGRGASSPFDVVFSPNERADAQSRLSQIVDSIGRLQSGGAITSDEAERFEEWINAGFGDERLIQNLRNIQQMATASVKRSERALPDRLRAQYRRMDAGMTAGLEADPVGASGRVNRQRGDSVVSEDQ